MRDLSDVLDTLCSFEVVHVPFYNLSSLSDGLFREFFQLTLRRMPYIYVHNSV